MASTDQPSTWRNVEVPKMPRRKGSWSSVGVLMPYPLSSTTKTIGRRSCTAPGHRLEEFALPRGRVADRAQDDATVTLELDSPCCTDGGQALRGGRRSGWIDPNRRNDPWTGICRPADDELAVARCSRAISSGVTPRACISARSR